MKRIYENFEELADSMTKGEGILHAHNCPYEDEFYKNDGCISWQKGVQDFGRWLDHIGVKVNITDKAENFYDFIAKRKPTKQRK